MSREFVYLILSKCPAGADSSTDLFTLFCCSQYLWLPWGFGLDRNKEVQGWISNKMRQDWNSGRASPRRGSVCVLFTVMQDFKWQSRVAQLLGGLTANAGSTLHAICSTLAQKTKQFCCLDANLVSWISKCFMGSHLQGSQSFIYEYSLCRHCHLSLIQFLATPSKYPLMILLWTPQATSLFPTCVTAAPITVNVLLKALPLEETSPLRLPSTLANSPLLMCTHRTSFSLISFIWGNSWTTPAVSLHEQFRKWGDNLSPSYVLRLGGGGLQIKLTVCKIFEVKGREAENQWNFPSRLGCIPFTLCCLSSLKGAQLAYFFSIILILW